MLLNLTFFPDRNLKTFEIYENLLFVVSNITSINNSAVLDKTAVRGTYRLTAIKM